jgi:hypothetical protein
MTDPPTSQTRSYFTRSMYAGRDLEFFMVTAIATILIVRAALAATGWPQLGGGKIHFAHLLWGGLGMLIAFVIFMAMKGRLWDLLATLAAGIGFGLFIDELGKFITSDNDYFFRPVVAFIYLIFVVLFLVTRALVATARPTPQAALVNLYGLASEAAVRPLNGSERTRALQLLAACDPADPAVQNLTRTVSAIAAHASADPGIYERLSARASSFYASIVEKRWVKGLVVTYLALIALVGLVAGIAVIASAAGEPGTMTRNFWTYGEAISASVTAAFIVVGFARWRHSRLAAYRWLERALLVAILITEFFAFYQDQLAEVFGLVIVLLTYAALKAMSRQEESRERAESLG